MNLKNQIIFTQTYLLPIFHVFMMTEISHNPTTSAGRGMTRSQLALTTWYLSKFIIPKLIKALNEGRRSLTPRCCQGLHPHEITQQKKIQNELSLVLKLSVALILIYQHNQGHYAEFLTQWTFISMALFALQAAMIHHYDKANQLPRAINNTNVLLDEPLPIISLHLLFPYYLSALRFNGLTRDLSAILMLSTNFSLYLALFYQKIPNAQKSQKILHNMKRQPMLYSNTSSPKQDKTTQTTQLTKPAKNWWSDTSLTNSPMSITDSRFSFFTEMDGYRSNSRPNGRKKDL